MSCGPHITSRQRQARNRNSHVRSVTRQTISRRAGTTAAHLTTNSRDSAKKLREASKARPQPEHTRLGQARSKASQTARQTAHKTAHATASKHAHQTASAHAQATARAHAIEKARERSLARAQETARQKFLHNAACNINTRDAVRVPRGAYRSRLTTAPGFESGTLHGRGFKPARPVKAAKASRSSRSVKAVRAR